MRFETSLLDKILNKALLGKRQLGRPLKQNIPTKETRGVLELVYKPRNKLEAFVGRCIHGSLPVLSYYTYRFHVERARAAGLRLEDVYFQKFFREPYVQLHVYAQNFHPWTMNERVRNVHFYRKTKTLFKGFKVPDWAQPQRKEDGFDVDIYSRDNWTAAMRDFNSEWTATPFKGDRVDPNPLNWFRFEQVGKGLSSRLFFNEVPKPAWHRHGGHLDDVDKTLYSFKYADQQYEDVLGFDLTTADGRKALQAEIQRMKKMAPELHEAAGAPDSIEQLVSKKYVSTEPHFQRVLTHYRAHLFQDRVSQAVASGALTEEDVRASRAYMDGQGLPSASMITLGQSGQLDGQAGYDSFVKVLEATGLSGFKRNIKTAMPDEDQFQRFFDNTYNVTELGLNKALPVLIADTKQRDKIRALLEAGQPSSSQLPAESTKQFAL